MTLSLNSDDSCSKSAGVSLESKEKMWSICPGGGGLLMWSDMAQAKLTRGATFKTDPSFSSLCAPRENSIGNQQKHHEAAVNRQDSISGIRSSSESFSRDGISAASDRGIDASVAIKQHRKLRREIVTLKKNLARVLSTSNEDRLHSQRILEELNTLREENKRLSRENEYHRENSVKTVHGQDSIIDDQRVMEELKHLQTKIARKVTVAPNEVVRVIMHICNSANRKLHRAKEFRRDLELDLQVTSIERDQWKFEAERLAAKIREGTNLQSRGDDSGARDGNTRRESLKILHPIDASSPCLSASDSKVVFATPEPCHPQRESLLKMLHPIDASSPCLSATDSEVEF